MATYRVVRTFYDLQDSAYPYKVGDSYPRTGLAVSDARIKELASDENRLGVPLIEAVKTTKRKKE